MLSKKAIIVYCCIYVTLNIIILKLILIKKTLTKRKYENYDKRKIKHKFKYYTMLLAFKQGIILFKKKKVIILYTCNYLFYYN